jgi:hypothetical protein
MRNGEYSLASPSLQQKEDVCPTVQRVRLGKISGFLEKILLSENTLGMKAG